MMTTSSRISVGIVSGVVITLMLILTSLSYPAIRHCVRLSSRQVPSPSDSDLQGQGLREKYLNINLRQHSQ